VAALGDNVSSFGFADESLRPPGNIGNQPRWPINRAPAAPPPQGNYQGNYQGSYQGSHSGNYPANYPAPRQPGYAAPSNGPISLSAPGVGQQEDDIDLPPEGMPAARGGGYPPRDRYPAASPAPYAQPSLATPPGRAAARAGAGQSGQRPSARSR
jgi:hypothetical protein